MSDAGGDDASNPLDAVSVKEEVDEVTEIVISEDSDVMCRVLQPMRPPDDGLTPATDGWVTSCVGYCSLCVLPTMAVPPRLMGELRSVSGTAASQRRPHHHYRRASNVTLVLIGSVSRLPISCLLMDLCLDLWMYVLRNVSRLVNSSLEQNICIWVLFTAKSEAVY